MRNVVIAVVALILIAAGVYAYTKQKASVQSPTPVVSQPSPTAMQETPSTAASPSAGESMTGAVKEIKVAGTEFAFDPMTITVKKGDQVKITFTNNGQYPHNFTLSQLGLATKTIQPGQSDSISFTADKAGTFDYECTVDSHASKGMKGTLTVQ